MPLDEAVSSLSAILLDEAYYAFISSQLLAPATRIPLDQKIGDDMTRFLTTVASNNSIDPKALQLSNATTAGWWRESRKRIKLIYPAAAAAMIDHYG